MQFVLLYDSLSLTRAICVIMGWHYSLGAGRLIEYVTEDNVCSSPESITSR